MKNTISILEHKNTKIVAHRGLSGIEPENTNLAFVAAGNRSYFGIETDIHVTKDGRFIIHHDDNTQRMSGESYIIEQTDYDTLRKLQLKPRYGDERNDITMPDLTDYINICKNYGKVAVIELKNAMEPKKLYEICETIEALEYFENTIFISFEYQNLVYVREKYADANLQFLVSEFTNNLFDKLNKYNIDLDIYYEALDARRIDSCHKAGIKVNCWTCDDVEAAQQLINWGVDYITSNILE